MLDVIANNYVKGEWIATLPKYQQNIINELLNNDLTDDDIARIWSSDIKTASLAPFGGQPNKSFYDAFTSEFRAFICGDEKYNELRNKITQQWQQGKIWIVSMIATAIASTIGTTIALVTPLVTIFLEMACALGLNTWCARNAAT